MAGVDIDTEALGEIDIEKRYSGRYCSMEEEE
jgi:hypothetical protein